MDLAGAVSLVDPEPLKFKDTKAGLDDPKTFAVMQGRASLSGIQPKLMLIKDNHTFRPSHRGELSTYIGKFPSPQLPDIIENEYLTTLACKRLFPEDEFVDLMIGSVEGISEEALIIKRFDRTFQGQRIHFEEFNQLLEKPSRNKYEGAYKDMADFLQKDTDALPLDIIRLFNRIIMGIAVGNTDMHFKNFALIYTNHGMRLSPNYDLVSASAYHPSYQAMALSMGGAPDLYINSLKPKNILALANEFNISRQAIQFAVEQLRKNLPHAQEDVFSSPFGAPYLKDQLIKQMDKRWNGTFSSIGKALLEKL
jgi:serine/threonine-protein kinase HipA